MNGERDMEQERRHRAIAVWLLVVVAAVFGMIVLGGLTRLTESGLSMVDWKPVTGWLPPLTEAEWEEAFAAYRQYPEYALRNVHMTLAGFQEIYWLEYLHRLWGRMIGVLFAVPFLVFLARGWIGRRMGWRLASVFVLGGLQGAMGWYMVLSGMVDRPDVSQYRLTAHLVFALAILAALLWMAMDLLSSRRSPSASGGGEGGLAWGARGVLALVVLAITAGGFVAGTGAGFTHNTYPLMEGSLLPSGLYAMDPWWRSAFEDLTTIQFQHRHLGELTGVATLALWALGRRRGVRGTAATALDVLAAAVMAQVGLGILTLLLVVPIWAAALHQAGAVLVFGAALWSVHQLRPAPAAAAAVPATA